MSSSKTASAQAMLDWLTSSGGYVHPSTSLKSDPITGLSVFSTAPIGPNERLVSCPFDLAITPELATLAICSYSNIEGNKLIWPAGSSKAGEVWNERMRIGAYIGLHWVDKDGGTGSSLLKHLPYIESLPSPADLLTPLYFTSDEMGLLSGTNLHGAVEDRRRDWQAESEVIRSGLKIDGLTWERYLAAATYLSSRAFPSKLLRLPPDGQSTSTSAVDTSDDEESHPVLLPGVDLLNHSRGQPILWLSSLISTPKGEAIPSVSLISTRPHPSSTQLYNNYGPKSNEELLLGYGFVLPDNPDDTLILKLGLTNVPTKTMEKLKSNRLDLNKRFVVRRDGELDKELLDVVRCLCIDPAEDEDGEVDEEDEHALHEREEMEMELELGVLGLLGDMLEKKMEKLSVEDEATEQSNKIRENVRAMCEIYRRGQHDILKAALAKIEERTDRVEKMLDQGMGGCSCCS